MALVVYNTLTRRKEVFQPLSAAETPPGEKPLVRMYVCGVTVYDLCHLGHARTYVVWDTVRRYLEWRGYRVKYVQNFTDVDDKILKRALERGESMQAVAETLHRRVFPGHGSPQHQAGRSLPPGKLAPCRQSLS
jgi:cysteinyl-tRNA synthetase